MKTFTSKTATIYILVLLTIQSFAQELPEQYRENFSESFPIRKEQRLEIKSYINQLAKENTDRSLKIFQPNYFSTEDYKNSLFPYRKILGNYFGYPPPKKIDGRITKFAKIGEDKYSDFYRVWVEVIEGIHTYGLYMVPKKRHGKTPMIIAMHGGGGNPEAICGLDTRVNYHNFGYEAVKRGYIVWAPALLMHSNYSGDEKMPGLERTTFDTQLKQLGSSIIGLEIHKIIESTKAIMNEREEIDQERVGMTGLSWGGFFTMYTTALCPFIKAAAPSAYFTDSKADLMEISDPEKRNPEAHTHRGLGHFQVIGLICPRPCLVQMGANDMLFDLNGAKIEADKASQFYKKLGKAERFEFNIHKGGHEFEIESIFDFFNKHIR